MSLDENTIRAARAIFAKGKISIRAIAKRLGVAYPVLWEAVSPLGRRWKHLDIDSSNEPAHALYRSFSPDDREWIATALIAVRKLASEMDVFTVDDIWAELDGVVDAPADRSVMGGVMKIAVFEAMCSATDRYSPSTRKESHRRPVRLWRSEITT